MSLPAIPEWYAGLHLLRPLWLWALLAMPLLGWWWRRRIGRESAWRAAVDPHLLPHLLEPGGGRRGHAALALGLIAYALAVLALTGPSWRQVEQPAWQTRAPLVVALDLSTAITATDLPPSRLLQARAKLATLLRERSAGQVALVAYAGDAFTVAPLTDDAANVALFLDALEPSVMPVDGQRGDRAIAWSVRLLRQAGFDQGEVLLLTDHADPRARAAAAEARRQGYRVSALGLGTAAGSAYRTGMGAIAQARLDAGSLQALATEGGGTYAVLAPGREDLAALGVLDPPHTGGSVAGGSAGRQWQDQGYWLLPPLLLLGLLAFRRGAATAAVLLCVWLPLQSLPAAATTTAASTATPAAGSLWQRPDQQAHARLRNGIEAYRSGDFDAAAQAFAAVDSADGHYNRGNALAKAGKYRQAIAAYDRALAAQPGMPDALANKAAVEAFLQRQPPPGPREQQRGRDQDGDGGDQGDSRGQGERNPGEGEDAPSQPPPEAKSTPPESTDPADPPGEDDAERQRQADAAMREALDREREQAAQEAAEKARQEDAAAADPDETPEQRERRLANQAWLQRVPDDPGGLLRRKFALEYARRQRQGDTP